MYNHIHTCIYISIFIYSYKTNKNFPYTICISHVDSIYKTLPPTHTYKKLPHTHTLLNTHICFCAVKWEILGGVLPGTVHGCGEVHSWCVAGWWAVDSWTDANGPDNEFVGDSMIVRNNEWVRGTFMGAGKCFHSALLDDEYWTPRRMQMEPRQWVRGRFDGSLAMGSWEIRWLFVKMSESVNNCSW